MARTKDPHAATLKAWESRERAQQGVGSSSTQLRGDFARPERAVAAGENRIGSGVTSDAPIVLGRPIPGAKVEHPTYADGSPASPTADVEIGPGDVNPEMLKQGLKNLAGRPQEWRALFRDVAEAEVDGEVEANAFHAVLAESRAFYSDNSADARAIRASDDDPREALEEIDRRGLHVTTVFVANPKDHGAGSGGPGSAKVFWTPYSVPNRDERLTQNDYHHGNQFGTDPIYVTAHEMHHAYGLHSEFDQSSDVVGVAAHLRLMAQGQHPATARMAARDGALHIVSGIWAKKGSVGAACRRKFRYLYKRYPDQLRRLLCDDPRTGERNGYYSEAEFDRMMGLSVKS